MMRETPRNSERDRPRQKCLAGHRTADQSGGDCAAQRIRAVLRRRQRGGGGARALPSRRGAGSAAALLRHAVPLSPFPTYGGSVAADVGCLVLVIEEADHPVVADAQELDGRGAPGRLDGADTIHGRDGREDAEGRLGIRPSGTRPSRACRDMAIANMLRNASRKTIFADLSNPTPFIAAEARSGLNTISRF